MKELLEKARAYDGNYKVYIELINRLENIKEVIKKQNYGIAIDILHKPYPKFQIITSTEHKDKSEGDKIRKSLFEYFKNRKDDGDIDETWYGISYDEILAWLEKQGEQKPCMVQWKGDRVQPQPKQEWKQENTGDLTDFEIAMMHIGDSFFGQYAGLDPNDTSAIKEQANLLLELVPKQEWSEEDEKTLNSILNDLRQNVIPDREDIDWLKSLKSRDRWKPSDQELGAILVAIGDERQKGSDVAKELQNIYQQLKKLR